MLRILAVEDNLGDQVLLKEALQEIGIEHTLIFAPCANESIKNIYIDNPDLIFMDINMPGLSGDEFVALFQTGPYTTRSKKVVFLTGATLTDDQWNEQTQEIKVKDKSYPLLRKPVNPNDLNKIISKMHIEKGA